MSDDMRCPKCNDLILKITSNFHIEKCELPQSSHWESSDEKQQMTTKQERVSDDVLHWFLLAVSSRHKIEAMLGEVIK